MFDFYCKAETFATKTQVFTLKIVTSKIRQFLAVNLVIFLLFNVGEKPELVRDMSVIHSLLNKC